MKLLIASLLALCFIGSTTWAEAISLLDWHRSRESDVVSYNVYACLTAGCQVQRTPGMLQTNVVQVAAGQTPSWSYDPSTVGQVCITAVDASNNESPCSCAVDFAASFKTSCKAKTTGQVAITGGGKFN